MKRLFFITLSILTLTGCELIGKIIGYDYERVKWINPDVECCGVKDPLNNLAWLNDWYKNSYFNEESELNYQSYGFIYVFENDSTLENFIVIRNLIYESLPCRFWLYTCEGEFIDGGYYYDYDSKNIFSNDVNAIPLPPCDYCDEFFQTHILVDTIAYFYTNKFLN